MRVGERGASQVRAEAAPGGRFAEALRRARDPEGARRDARLDPRRPATRPGPGPDAAGVLSRADDRSAPPPQPAAAAGPAAEVQATPALAALARALPVAIAAAAREGAPLALSFGRSLDVELRTSPGGVALLLRPGPRLERAAEAELPRLVAALRARGVAVARAGVQPRGGARRSR
jgi:hypothetical protein